MNHSAIIHQLTHNLEVFKSLLSEQSKEVYLWKPYPDKWCLLEIVCHLYDEEREDFRARVKHVLENPELPLPSIDPAGWVKERKYMEQDYEEKLDAFLKERKQSAGWLQSLDNPGWTNAYMHPKFGEMPAQLFLANWLAHDYLHFRQITGLKYQYLRAHSEESLDYAGAW